MASDGVDDVANAAPDSYLPPVAAAPEQEREVMGEGLQDAEIPSADALRLALEEEVVLDAASSEDDDALRLALRTFLSEGMALLGNLPVEQSQAVLDQLSSGDSVVAETLRRLVASSAPPTPRDPTPRETPSGTRPSTAGSFRPTPSAAFEWGLDEEALLAEGLQLLGNLPREHRESVMGELAQAPSELAETLRKLFAPLPSASSSATIEGEDGSATSRASGSGSSLLPSAPRSEGHSCAPSASEDGGDVQGGGTQRTGFSTDEDDEHLMRDVEKEASAPSPSKETRDVGVGLDDEDAVLEGERLLGGGVSVETQTGGEEWEKDILRDASLDSWEDQAQEEEEVPENSEEQWEEAQHPAQDDALSAGIALWGGDEMTRGVAQEGVSVAAGVLDVGDGARPQTAGGQSPDGGMSAEHGTQDGEDDLWEEEEEEGDGGVGEGEGAEQEDQRLDACELALEALRLHATLSDKLQDAGTFSMAIEAFPAIMEQRAAAAAERERAEEEEARLASEAADVAAEALLAAQEQGAPPAEAGGDAGGGQDVGGATGGGAGGAGQDGEGGGAVEAGVVEAPEKAGDTEGGEAGGGAAVVQADVEVGGGGEAGEQVLVVAEGGVTQDTGDSVGVDVGAEAMANGAGEERGGAAQTDDTGAVDGGGEAAAEAQADVGGSMDGVGEGAAEGDGEGAAAIADEQAQDGVGVLAVDTVAGEATGEGAGEQGGEAVAAEQSVDELVSGHEETMEALRVVLAQIGQLWVGLADADVARGVKEVREACGEGADGAVVRSIVTLAMSVPGESASAKRERRRWLDAEEDKTRVLEEMGRVLRAQEAQIAAMQAQLDQQPVVRVREEVDALTGEASVSYSFNRVSYREEEAALMRAAAEAARAIEDAAEHAAGVVRRAEAEEAFRLEAAKAEVRLEAYRIQQRRMQEERRRSEEMRRVGKDERSIAERKRATKDPAVKEGWMSFRQRVPPAQLERRWYVLRPSGLQVFRNELLAGGCLNAFGLERITRVGMLGGTTVEVAHDGGTLLLQCESETARNEWVKALDAALSRFRRTAVARPEVRRPVVEVGLELRSPGKRWDAGVEERVRGEVEARRVAVRKANLLLHEADKNLDAARHEHQVADRELRMRLVYTDMSPEFIASLPAAEPRDNKGYRKYQGGGKFADAEGGGGGMSVEDIEKMVQAAKDETEAGAKLKLDENNLKLRSKIKVADEARLGAEKELQAYKDMAFKGGADFDEPTNYAEMTPKQQADYDAARFEGAIYADGTMTVPDGFLSAKTVHVFTEGGDAVLFQGGQTTLLRPAGGDDDGESGRAAKMPLLDS